MKQAFVLLLVLALAGCATNKAVLPSLQGKPRVKVNQQAPVPAAPAAPAPVTNETGGR